MEDMMFDRVEVQEMELRLMQKFSESREKTLTKFDQLVANLDEITALAKARWGHHKQGVSSICNQKTPSSTQNHNSKGYSKVGFTQTPLCNVSEQRFFVPIENGDADTTPSQKRITKGRHFVAVVDSVPVVVEQLKEPTTEVYKNLTPPNLVSNRSEFMSSCFEIHSGNVSSPPLLDDVSTISAKEIDSTLQNGSNGFMCVTDSRDFKTPIALTPTTIPPPEPPDRVVVPAPTLKPFLSMTTTRGLAAIQSPDVNSYTTLLTALHVFDPVPKCHVDVWNIIITGCTDTRPEDVGFVISHWKGLDRF